MSASFRYLRPDKLMTRDATVTGTIDPAYQASWLCDLRPGFPVRSTTVGSPAVGGLSLTVVGTSRLCNFAAATHLRLDDAANISLGGGITATLSGRGDQADDIPLNRWTTFAPVTSAGCTVTVAGNTGAAIIGELFIGEADSLPQPLYLGARHGFQSFKIAANAEFASVLDYDKGLVGETLSGKLIVTDDELSDLKQAFKACRDGTLPLVIVPDDTADDCFVVEFLGIEWSDLAPGDINTNPQALYDVTLTFREIPRGRW